MEKISHESVEKGNCSKSQDVDLSVNELVHEFQEMSERVTSIGKLLLIQEAERVRKRVHSMRERNSSHLAQPTNKRPRILRQPLDGSIIHDLREADDTSNEEDKTDISCKVTKEERQTLWIQAKRMKMMSCLLQDLEMTQKWIHAELLECTNNPDAESSMV